MKGKKKYVIALSITAAIAVILLASLIGVLAAFSASLGSDFKVSFTAADHINAKVTAATSLNGFNLETTPLKAGDADFIEFNENDTEDVVNSKHFNAINVTVPAGKSGEISPAFYVVYTIENKSEGNITVNVSETTGLTKQTNVEFTWLDSNGDAIDSLSEVSIAKDESFTFGFKVSLLNKTQAGSLEGSISINLALVQG